MQSAKIIQKLRFPGFSGEWQRNELGEITKWFSGGTPAKDNPKYWGGDIPWISAASMYGSTFSRSERTLTELGARSGTKMAKQGSLLLLVRGSMLFNTIPVGVAGRDVAFNQDVKAITSDILDSRYLLYFFQASEHKLLSKVVGTGIGAGKLDMEDLSGLPIAVPSLDEQQKIAEFLTAVDDRIGMGERRLELLKKYKQGVMQKIFTQQLRFRDENGQSYPEWEGKELRNIGEIIGGGTPDTMNAAYWGGEINWLTPTEVKSSYIDSSERSITQAGLKNSAATVLPVGTIIFTSRATIGDAAISRVRLVTNQGFQSIVVNEMHDNRFIYYWVIYSRKVFLRRASGSTFPEISRSEMRKVPIFVPVKQEQQKIAGFLAVLDDKIKLEESKLEQVRNFKKSLLQQMFI